MKKIKNISPNVLTCQDHSLSIITKPRQFALALTRRVSMDNFSINQIVRGKFAGVFVILDIFTDKTNGMRCARLKEVNPNNLSETAPGGIALPLDCIRPYC